MAEPGTEFDYSRFTVKDMLSLVVLPRLDSIDRKLDTKAEATEQSILRLRVLSLESWKNKTLGALSVITIVFGSLIAILARAIGL